jgi:type II restriction/modification system DNA methylase subunit YeeA
VKKEEIPAATQLFTPKWIVEYMVDNSLGRLWMLNHPNSKLIEKMEYYIKPEQPETDFLRINKPEEIKFCDPACGSGHILAYAFDLFYAMYEEEGYEPAEIPAKILTHNLYGIEIDDRAGALTAFALTMKARTRHRRFFRKPVTPNICVLKNVQFDDKEIDEYKDFVGRDLFTTHLQNTIGQFEEADNFGSLIRPEVTDVAGLMKILESKNIEEHMFLSRSHQKLIQVLKQADYLSPKYHVVVANPPYMGGKGMNGRLGAWLKDNYADVKSDLFSAFMVRNIELCVPKGHLGCVTPYVWMFISSFEKLRHYILDNSTITSLIQLEYNAFAPACIPVATFTLTNLEINNFKGAYIRLSDFRGAENQGPKTIEAIKNSNCGWFYQASAADFNKIPGSPIAYWVSDKIRNLFGQGTPIGDIAAPRKGNTTTDNNRFLRFWPEISFEKVGLHQEDNSKFYSGELKWCPYNKGGGFRKWFGFNEFLINWEFDGAEIKAVPHSVIANEQFFFKQGLTWSTVTSGRFSIRRFGNGYIFDNGGCCVFGREKTLSQLLPFMNSKVFVALFSQINPTLNFQSGEVAKVPFLTVSKPSELKTGYELSKSDWDVHETSWDFTALPLLRTDFYQPTIKDTYQKLRTHWHEMTQEMQRLEEENNRIFIEAYGLQDELEPEVPLKEITLTFNPHYRYGGNKNDEELEALLLADTIRELISYAVGCMFGRYALDKPGLILANQGETIEDYLKQIPEPTFTPDEDNVIPLLDADWFSDDITERFKQFLRITFGEEHYEENLTFIEQGLNIKGKRSYTIRDYFLSEFYSDHVRRYKKRPIYWLFSSPKGSFNALIYMHRYQPYTASTVLSYLRDFKNEKLRAHKNQLEAVSISASASKSEKTRALKEIEKVNKIITELDAYERDILYPLATKQVEIDLDDGVKVNYPKFGAALKKIPGLT